MGRLFTGCLLICATVCATTAVRAAQPIAICHAYGCNASTEVRFSDAELKELHRFFVGVRNAEEERDTAARVVGLFYLLAGKQSPVWQDHGENDDDEELIGRMDCIDHSTNTTVFLRLMQQSGWLRFHDVAEPVQRGFWAAHWAARLIERADGSEWIIDSWFFDPGRPAAVFPLDTWRRGAAPIGFKETWQ